MWKSGRIEPVRRLTERSIELRLTLQGGMPSASPGQFIVMEIERDGHPMRASFSLAAIEKDHWLLAVKVARPNGVSAWLNALSGKAKVSIAGPFGDFNFSAATRQVFVAGGSGITPIYCLVQEAFRNGIVPVIVYANESPADAMYLKELQHWNQQGACHLIEVYDRNFEPVLDGMDFRETEVYVCGPSAMNQVVQGILQRQVHSPKNIQIEHYGVPTQQSEGGTVLWSPRFAKSKRIELKPGETLLSAATRAGVNIDAACLVGACKTCKVKLDAGQMECNGEVMQSGQEVLACCVRSNGGATAMVSPVKGLSRPQWFVAAVLAGLVFLGMWNVPPGLGMSSKGSMNTGHSNLDCESCHRPASGTLRQQLGHNARTAIGAHEHDWVAVGYAPVTNESCQSCHDRPNDRHPVSRFEELRFASQRETLGPHRCVNCHGEHTGKRIGKVGMDYCSNCHSDMQVKEDPIHPSHAELAQGEEWMTCMTCHDFHGNHIMEVPVNMQDRLRVEEIQAYFEGGKDPYSDDKKYRAKSDD